MPVPTQYHSAQSAFFGSCHAKDVTDVEVTTREWVNCEMFEGGTAQIDSTATHAAPWGKDRQRTPYWNNWLGKA
ncbi:MAG: hypothetical protein PHR16_04120 [Methylovulum sp.]|nr:hypothetical protein [Methylovulum sp.]